jgi:alkanesulfonate monooxygenase SsuD/methylene tetrahydromethanopterin reductase-like flavin-dependent oxidoreductase (luciferase family)
MEIGLALPQYDYSVPGENPLRWESVEAWADRAVALGFTSLWVSDHLFLSLEKYGGPSDRFDCFDPIVALSALAQRHPTTTLGCLVFCAQLRAPKLLAKQLETLDRLSPGRMVAGMGAGWYEPEFDVAGLPFERPGVRLRQLVDATTEVKDYLGERRIPIWFGGKGDRLVDLAARHADGWNTVWAWRPEDFRRKVEIVERACDEAGRDPSTFTLSVGLTTLVGSDGFDLRRRWQRRLDSVPGRMLDTEDFDAWRSERLVGTVETVRDQVNEWRRIGVSLLVVNLGALPFSVTDPDDLALVASALI